MFIDLKLLKFFYFFIYFTFSFVCLFLLEISINLNIYFSYLLVAKSFVKIFMKFFIFESKRFFFFVRRNQTQYKQFLSIFWKLLLSNIFANSLLNIMSKPYKSPLPPLFLSN